MNTFFKSMKIIATTLLLVSLSVTLAASAYQVNAVATLLDPTTIPKWVNQLNGPPPVYVPTVVRDGRGNVIRYEYTVSMTSFQEQILPSGYPMTPVWGYGGLAENAVTGAFLGFVQNSPGPSFVATRGIASVVNWQNLVFTPQQFAVDPTLDWANPNNMITPTPPFNPFPPGYADAQYPAALVPHLHGAEVSSRYDGGPMAWFTATGQHGMNYNTARPTTDNGAVYIYPNQQPTTTLWYHDHAMGTTRINVMEGLAGFYMIKDPTDPIARQLPSGKYDIPLAIQDRIFYSDGRMFFPNVPDNPQIHAYWLPEFFGNVIMVNGLVWPNMNVDRGQYRFRLLDGSNARFYNFSFSNGMPFTWIATDGGYLQSPVTVTSLLMAPGQRNEILVDFSRLAPGTTVVLQNDAAAPYPMGDPDNFDPDTVGQIMQFTVTNKAGFVAKHLPLVLNRQLNGQWPTLSAGTNTRIRTLFEADDEFGNPVMVTVNGQRFDGTITEDPEVGATEDWVIVNLTPDAHPMHTHLTQFQLVSRQDFDVDAYTADWLALQQQISGNATLMPPYPLDFVPAELDPTPYLQGDPIAAQPYEHAWRDTLITLPGQVTIIRIRWAPISTPLTGKGSAQPGVNLYPFDPTDGPGYVWHCHIIDHEDNEMMRPYIVTP